MCKLGGRDHNATSYSTETGLHLPRGHRGKAEIITLRAIALKPRNPLQPDLARHAEIITLRAIALKLGAARLAK